MNETNPEAEEGSENGMQERATPEEDTEEAPGNPTSDLLEAKRAFRREPTDASQLDAATDILAAKRAVAGTSSNTVIPASRFGQQAAHNRHDQGSPEAGQSLSTSERASLPSTEDSLLDAKRSIYASARSQEAPPTTTIETSYDDGHEPTNILEAKRSISSRSNTMLDSPRTSTDRAGLDGSFASVSADNIVDAKRAIRLQSSSQTTSETTTTSPNGSMTKMRLSSQGDDRPLVEWVEPFQQQPQQVVTHSSDLMYDEPELEETNENLVVVVEEEPLNDSALDAELVDEQGEREEMERQAQVKIVQDMEVAEIADVVTGRKLAVTVVAVIALLTAVIVGGVCGSGHCTPESLEACDISLQVTCRTLTGQRCEDAGAPYTSSCLLAHYEEQLAKGTHWTTQYHGMTSLKFSYQASSCGDSNNQQGAFCLDHGTSELPDTALVQCDSYYSYAKDCDCRLTSQEYPELGTSEPIVAIDEYIELFASEGSSDGLPIDLECNIRHPNTTALLQTIRFDSTKHMDLREVFGSLRLEGCGSLSCVQDARVVSEATNSGKDEWESALTILSVDGERVDLDSASGLTFDTGEQTNVVEYKQTINTCGGSVGSAIAAVQVLTKKDETCQTVAKFEFQYPQLEVTTPEQRSPEVNTSAAVPPTTQEPLNECGLQIEASCVVVESSELLDKCMAGLACNEVLNSLNKCLMPPPAAAFNFTGGMCGNSTVFHESCTDHNVGGVNPGDQYEVAISESIADTLQVEEVEVGGRIEASLSPGRKLTFEVRDPSTGQPMQTVTVDQSYFASPQGFGASFGAFQYIARQPPRGDGSSSNLDASLQVLVTANSPVVLQTMAATSNLLPSIETGLIGGGAAEGRHDYPEAFNQTLGQATSNPFLATVAITLDGTPRRIHELTFEIEGIKDGIACRSEFTTGIEAGTPNSFERIEALMKDGNVEIG